VFHHLYYHLTWTTRGRDRLIDAGLANFLCRYLRAVARQERAHVLEVGMVATHVHVLLRAHPTTDLTRLVQRAKGGSSALAGSHRRVARGFS
jgi:REP element-mobilizing transposase RayT